MGFAPQGSSADNHNNAHYTKLSAGTAHSSADNTKYVLHKTAHFACYVAAPQYQQWEF
jgi:hypothetical protein